MEMNNKLSWLKTSIVHGDFEDAPDDFDIFDEIEISKRKRFERDDTAKDEDTVKKGGGEKKPPTGTEVPTTPKFEDPLLDEAYQFGKNDDLLKLIRDTLWEIREFEMELDASFEQLENKFDKKEYQYDTTST
jgi:hypothetical protein